VYSRPASGRPLGSTVEGIEKGSQGSNERDQAEEKGAGKRGKRDSRREIERSVRDGRRYGERRSTRWEGTEERDWDTDSLPRPDTEG
jgi:hypothetical protein